MGWRAWDAYESEARERWRALPWRERYGWNFFRAVAVLAVIAAAFLFLVLR